MAQRGEESGEYPDSPDRQPVVRDPELQERRLTRAAAFRAAASAFAKSPRPTPVRLVALGEDGGFVRVHPEHDDPIGQDDAGEGGA